MWEHKNALGDDSYTKTRLPVKLVYSEEYANVLEAIAREKQLKRRSHNKKAALIENDVKKLIEISKCHGSTSSLQRRAGTMTDICMKNKIKFVFFDIGGVILHFKHQFEELEKVHGVDKDKAQDVWAKHIGNLSVGLLEQSYVWNEICEEADAKHLLEFDFSDFRASTVRPICVTHNLIADIEKSDIGIGLISNAEKGIIKLHIVRGNIPNVKYAHIVDSSEVGMRKPDRAIFEHAQSLIKVPKSSVLLVDDLEENCEAARLFGWQTIRFDEENPDKSVAFIRKKLNI